jgi:hypothetical protein
VEFVNSLLRMGNAKKGMLAILNMVARASKMPVKEVLAIGRRIHQPKMMVI